MLGIALYAGLKSQPIPQVVSHFDLILHFGVFCVMSALWSIGFPRRWRLPGMLFLCLVGFAIECWQGWALVGRTASVVDMAANITGVLAGAFAAVVFQDYFLNKFRGVSLI